MNKSVEVLLIGNDMVLELANLTSEFDATPLNAATVRVTLVDAAGVNVAGQSWPLALAYVAGSSGTYRASLPYGLPLAPDARYTARVTADAGSGKHAEWRIPCVARYR